jgi:hypothetical protein
MTAVTLTPEDLEPFATIDPVKATAMVEDALALAAVVAPCITTEAFAHPGAAKAILRGAVIRWHESGSGALQSTQTGPFGQTLDTRQPRRGMFWPSEIEQLQALCKSSTQGGAFTVDTIGTPGLVQHADICALRFGALYCSCGAVLTGLFPLYEQGVGY